MLGPNLSPISAEDAQFERMLGPKGGDAAAGAALDPWQSLPNIALDPNMALDPWPSLPNMALDPSLTMPSCRYAEAAVAAVEAGAAEALRRHKRQRPPPAPSPNIALTQRRSLASRSARRRRRTVRTGRLPHS